MAKQSDPDIIAQGNERARLMSIESYLTMRNKWVALRNEHMRLDRQWGIRAADRQIEKIDGRLFALGYVIGSD